MSQLGAGICLNGFRFTLLALRPVHDNPDATQVGGFVSFLEDEEFPTLLIEEVVDGWDKTTKRADLEMLMADLHTRTTQLVNGLLYTYQGDSLHSHPDSVLLAWHQLRAPSARFAEAGLLMDLDRYEEALDVITGFRSKYHLTYDSLLSAEVKRMMDYIDILATAYDDERSAYELDGGEVEDLEELIEDNYGRPDIWVSNLLCAVYGICRPPATGGDGEPKALRIFVQPAVDSPRVANLHIAPNPASASTTFTYALKGEQEDALLTINDLTGRAVHRIRLMQVQGVVTWTTQGQAPGVYMATLTEGGTSVITEKLVLQP